MSLLFDRPTLPGRAVLRDGGHRVRTRHDLASLRKRFVVCALLALTVCVLAASDSVDVLWRVRHWEWMPHAQLALAIPVVFWGGATLLRAFLASLRSFRFDTWTLLGLGVLSSFSYSAFVTMLPQFAPDSGLHAHGRAPVYFAASVAIVVCVVFVEYLELRCRRRANTALRDAFVPAIERELRADAGTEISLARMLAEIEAGREPSTLERSVERRIAHATPFVVVSAVVAFLYWAIGGDALRMTEAWEHAIAVLVVACPLALSLSPVFVRGVELALRRAVLFKHANALQAMASADALFVGMSGALTVGRPTLVGIDVMDERYDDTSLLALAAGFEPERDHALASALRASAAQLGITPALVVAAADADNSARDSEGLQGLRGGRRVGVGSLAMLERCGVHTAGLAAHARPYEEQALRVVWVFEERACIGALTFTDTHREDAAAGVRALRERGLEIVLITSEARATAQAIASEFEIEDVLAELPPERMAVEVERWQLERWKVALASAEAGIGDARALERADVGIALGGGGETVFESADVLVPRPGLDGLCRARDVSVRCLRVFKQHLAMLCALTGVGLPIAAGFFERGVGLRLAPLVVVLLLLAAALIVLLGALRQRG